MTLLSVVDQYRATEAVFRAWDPLAGECLLCNALFDTLEQAAGRYGLDLEALLEELNRAATAA